MANALNQIRRRNLGFTGMEGDVFNEASLQPGQSFNPTITNALMGYGERGIERPQFQGSPVDVFGQGRGYMNPSTGMIEGVNAQGQRFRIQPEGTAAAQQAAKDADLKRRLMTANVLQEEAKLNGQGGLSPADQLAREKFEWEKSQGKPEKPLTEFQGKAALFGSRAATSSDLIDKLGTEESGGAKTLQYWQDVPVAGRVANVMASNKAQQLAQAQRDFVNSVLRLESGATISDQEFANATQQYFPQPGDSKQVIEQKKQNREIAIQGLGELAGEKGGAYISKQRAAAQGQPSGQDAEAISWAKSNPNDPRAAKILSLHGM